MILVTAAGGNQGKRLIPKLLARGATVRALVRTAASGAMLRGMGVADVIVGDMADSDVMACAIDGVEKVYHVGPTLHPREREIGFAAIAAARASGVNHFVFLSVLHAITSDLVQHHVKRDIEEQLLSSGLEFTILQPSNYMLPHRLRAVFEQGRFQLSWLLERYPSLVDLGDVTDVAEAVLADSDSHAGATYELVAPERYNAHELGQIMSDIIARDVAVEQISADTFFKERIGEPSQFRYESRAMRAISERYSSHDFIGNSNVLTWLLGRPPITYGQFVQAAFDAYRATKA